MSAFFFLVLASFSKKVLILMVKFLESALIKCLTNFLHKLVVEIEVMKHRKTHSKCLTGLEKMSDVGARVMLTCGALTLLCNRLGIVDILLVEKVHLSLPGKEVTVACIS